MTLFLRHMIFLFSGGSNFHGHMIFLFPEAENKWNMTCAEHCSELIPFLFKNDRTMQIHGSNDGFMKSSSNSVMFRPFLFSLSLNSHAAIQSSFENFDLKNIAGGGGRTSHELILTKI